MNIILTLLLSLPLQSSSFSPAARLPFASNGVPSTFIRPAAVISSSRLSPSSALMAKKRRRRKTDSSAPTNQSDELPDFDDGEGEDFDDGEKESVEEEPIRTSSPMSVVASSSPVRTTPIKRGAGLDAQLAEEVGGNVDGLDQDVILGAMRGKGGGDNWVPPQSIQATLSDRGLEKFMDFDRLIEQDGGGETIELPDFDEVIGRRKQREAAGAMPEGQVQDAADAMKEGRVSDAANSLGNSSLGKKAARNLERKAAAEQREAEIEAEKSIFDFDFENVNVLKLLENGAWVGIGALVVWEVYINSPLFERASPIIPAVFELVM